MDKSLDLISLFWVSISIQTAWQLRQNWSKFWDNKVTLADKDLAMRAAIFLLVPLGVLLHEIGHSVATWQMGGTVATFRWFVFSGYIIPDGDFNFLQYWWISFAGNLVSILLGLLPIPFLFRIRKRIVAEVVYWFICFQSIYALVYYPLYSAFTRSGDWVTIYNFEFLPAARYLLLVHLVLLGGLWQLYNSQTVLKWRLARNPEALKKWHQLQAEQYNRPQDLQPQLDLAYFLLQHQETRPAQKIARRIYRDYTHNPSTQVLKTAICWHKRAYDRVLKLGPKLLDAELSQSDRAITYRLLCAASYQTGKLKQALEYANLGLELAPNDYMLLYHRGIIYRSWGKYDLAIASFERALANNPDEDLRELILKLKQHQNPST